MVDEVDLSRATLPGYDSLHALERKSANNLEINDDDRRRFLDASSANRELLADPHYNQYLQLPKVLLGQKAVHYLNLLGSRLEQQALPDYRDAAGWAFVEAAMIDGTQTEEYRYDLLDRAQQNWIAAMANYDQLDRAELADVFRDDSYPFRVALNLACLPAVRAIVAGDVTREVTR